MTNAAKKLSEAAGQVLVGGFSGTEIPSDFETLIRAGQVGGAILFSRNLTGIDQCRDLVQALRSIPAPSPLILSVDQEGGQVQRLRSPFPELPPLRAFGATGRTESAQAAGELLADALRLIGFHQDFAPVLDVDSNPANPVIGDRSAGPDPELVGRMGAAFIEGMQSRGVAACGKHFPGHGDTDLDSHLALPRLSHDKARLDKLELIPFRAAVKARVASMMTAHIVFSALDPDHPATLSTKVLHPLLREELGYEGVIVSDDLEMKAVADHYGIEDAAVMAVAAGCDQLLICHQPSLVERAHRALVDAVATGRLSADRLYEASERIRRLKATYVVDAPPPTEGPLADLLPSADPVLAMLV
ncbi:MAG: beta-N-acetylhexosaminidase [Myxococcota bacterium]